MTEYEKKQLELLVVQCNLDRFGKRSINKKLAKIEFSITITVISLAVVVGFLTFLRLKRKG
jgi:hypothetical protein